MAHKTFISYKYSDSENERDKIINKLGEHATYYNGEDGFSNDLSDKSSETIKKYLADMIFPTSILIVVMSSNIDQSEWVEWEINYATSKTSRNEMQSQRNRVIMINKADSAKDGKIANLIRMRTDFIEVNYQKFIENPSIYINEAPNEKFAKDKFDKIDIQYNIGLDAYVEADKSLHIRRKRLSEWLQKFAKIKNNRKLIFEVSRNNMPKDEFEKCKFYWKIRNMGAEVIDNEGSYTEKARGEIIEDSKIHEEPASFTGDHYVEVYLVKNNIVVARKKISVPIDVLNGID